LSARSPLGTLSTMPFDSADAGAEHPVNLFYAALTFRGRVAYS
jgi:hypothetical protein